MRITVRARPGASRTRVGGRYGAQEPPVLVVAVQERAVEGAATQALCRAIATAFRVRPAQVRLVSGATARTKIVEIDIDEGVGQRALAALLES